MKLNYIGIVGAIIAFVSIALPWWTESAGGLSYDLKLYDAGILGATLNYWYGWVALLFVVLGGVLGLAGSVMSNGKRIVMGGGILALIAIIIFPVGFQMDLMRLNATISIFNSGTVSAYLSYGFWLALVAAIIMLVAMRYPKPTAQAPSAPPPTPTT
ncbi:MAG: hypothetical protein ABSD73_07845 [Candidatus Bathyarchaeia archaeon]|jgi:hypothetical protein